MADDIKEALSWTRIDSFGMEDWRNLCNGSLAYSDKAPAILSASVVREWALRARIEELEARLAAGVEGPDHQSKQQGGADEP
jgi:hypothetical protein